jgi:hypothetical protein
LGCIIVELIDSGSFHVSISSFKMLSESSLDYKSLFFFLSFLCKKDSLFLRILSSEEEASLTAYSMHYSLVILGNF